MATLAQRFVRSSFVRGLSLASTLLVGFVMMPIVYKYLGKQMQGAWLLVFAVREIYVLLDFGLMQAISRFVSHAEGQGVRQQANQAIVSCFWLLMCSAVFVAAAAVSVKALSGLFVETPAEQFVVGNGFLLMGIAFALTMPLRTFEGVLTSHVRQDLIGAVEIVVALSTAGLSVLVLVNGGGVLALTVVFAVAHIFQRLTISLLAWRVHGRVSLRFPGFKLPAAADLLSYGVVAQLIQICNLLKNNIVTFVIAASFELGALVPFTIAIRLRDILKIGITMFASSTASVYSQHEGRKDYDALRSSYLLIYKMVCYFAVFVAAILAIIGDNFIPRWMGPDNIEAIPLLYILLGGAFIAAIQEPTIHLLYGLARHRYYLLTNAIEAVSTPVLIVVLVSRMGLIGVVIAMASPIAVLGVLVYPWLACSALRIGLVEYHLGNTLPNILKPGLFMAVAAIVARQFLSPDYLTIASVCLVTAATFAIYIYFVGFSNNERKVLLASLRLSGSTEQS